ncbi:hypothetical protein DL96DRAFT_1566778 [Flagelloscypha sp. PMI_526]|nr:hypothetical protein DL96DRAFT_1566778 [Flagelloscypha sp. PMI_526]
MSEIPFDERVCPAAENRSRVSAQMFLGKGNGLTCEGGINLERECIDSYAGGCSSSWILHQYGWISKKELDTDLSFKNSLYKYGIFGLYWHCMKVEEMKSEKAAGSYNFSEPMQFCLGSSRVTMRPNNNNIFIYDLTFHNVTTRPTPLIVCIWLYLNMVIANHRTIPREGIAVGKKNKKRIPKKEYRGKNVSNRPESTKGDAYGRQRTMRPEEIQTEYEKAEVTKHQRCTNILYKCLGQTNSGTFVFVTTSPSSRGVMGGDQSSLLVSSSLEQDSWIHNVVVEKLLPGGSTFGPQSASCGAGVLETKSEKNKIKLEPWKGNIKKEVSQKLLAPSRFDGISDA